MKYLLLLRGFPKDKKEWIERNNIQDFVIDVEAIRRGYYPMKNRVGHQVYDIHHEHKIMQTVLEMVESRMQRGVFTVVADYFHKPSKLGGFKRLGDIYGYRLYYKDFNLINGLEMDKGLCITHRNIIKGIEDSFKSTPMHSCFSEIDSISEIANIELQDFDDYSAVHVVSDLNHSVTVLKEAIESVKDNEALIVIGSSTISGRNPQEYYKLLISHFKANPDHFFYVNGSKSRLMRELLSTGFTQPIEEPELKEYVHSLIKDMSIDERAEFIKDMKRLYNSASDALYIEFRGQEYFINHGGLDSFSPEEFNIHVNAKDTCVGLSPIDIDIDAEYNKNFDGVIQIHGNRGSLIDSVLKVSYSLNANPNNGEHSPMLSLLDNGNVIWQLIKPTDFLWFDLPSEVKEKYKDYHYEDIDIKEDKLIHILNKEGGERILDEEGNALILRPSYSEDIPYKPFEEGVTYNMYAYNESSTTIYVGAYKGKLIAMYDYGYLVQKFLDEKKLKKKCRWGDEEVGEIAAFLGRNNLTLRLSSKSISTPDGYSSFFIADYCINNVDGSFTFNVPECLDNVYRGYIGTATSKEMAGKIREAHKTNNAVFYNTNTKEYQKILW